MFHQHEYACLLKQTVQTEHEYDFLGKLPKACFKLKAEKDID